MYTSKLIISLSVDHILSFIERKQPLFIFSAVSSLNLEVNLNVTCDLSSIIAEYGIFHQSQGWWQ